MFEPTERLLFSMILECLNLFSLILDFEHLHVYSICFFTVRSSHFISTVNHRITASQNDRGWRRPLEAIRFKPLLKQGHREQATQDHVQVAPRKRLHSFSEQPVTCTEKKFFLVFRRKLCPLPLVLALDTTENRLAVALHLLFRYS